MKTLFGLPAHPFFVHLPLVAVPSLAVCLAVMVFSPRSTRALMPLTACISMVVGAGLVLASASGEALVDALPYLRDEPFVNEHIRSSETARLWGVLTMTVVLIAWGSRRFAPSALRTPRVSRGILVLALVLSAATTIHTIRAGHAGTKARWFDIRLPGSEAQQTHRGAD